MNNCDVCYAEFAAAIAENVVKVQHSSHQRNSDGQSGLIQTQCSGDVIDDDDVWDSTGQHHVPRHPARIQRLFGSVQQSVQRRPSHDPAAAAAAAAAAAQQ